jgi:hypothetical protein
MTRLFFGLTLLAILGIPIPLPAEGLITGTVRSATGKPLANVLE